MLEWTFRNFDQFYCFQISLIISLHFHGIFNIEFSFHRIRLGWLNCNRTRLIGPVCISLFLKNPKKKNCLRLDLDLKLLLASFPWKKIHFLYFVLLQHCFLTWGNLKFKKSNSEIRCRFFYDFKLIFWIREFPKFLEEIAIKIVAIWVIFENFQVGIFNLEPKIIKNDYL